MIDVRDWLSSRTPAPPPELAERLASLVDGETSAGYDDLAALLVQRASDLMTDLGDDRSSAFDLLVADSLITYALEAAGEDCAGVEAIAHRTMVSISTVAGGEAKS